MRKHANLSIWRETYLDFWFDQPLGNLSSNLAEVGPDLSQDDVHPFRPLHVGEEDPAGQLSAAVQQLLLQLRSCRRGVRQLGLPAVAAAGRVVSCRAFSGPVQQGQG
jgi:hypothetical protein